MLRNTMADNLLSLFCLVDGEATSNAFSVEIDPSKTVDVLKKVIKSEKAIAFSDIDADQLTLWRVSIPLRDDDDELPILLNNVADKDKKKLGPVTRLSKVFPEDIPEESIHIIVQRPLQVHTPIPARASTPLPGYLSDNSRPATPIQLKSVPKDHIENELEVVLKGVNHHHITDPVDPKD
ncbi:hypothetical protein BGZ94_006218, partial [Podila epigama]